MMTISRVAIAQMTSTSSIAQNLDTVADLITKAHQQDASFICLPECVDYVSATRKQSVSMATPLTSNRFIDRLQSLSTQHNIWVSVGGIHELSPTNSSRIYNTHLILSPSETTPRAIYRKLHLFDAQLPSGPVSEHDTTDAGNELVLCRDTPLGNIGVTTCYDVRFAEQYTALRHAGAHTLLVPSAFFVPTGRAHWHVLLRARAIETQCFVVAAAQTGRHDGGRESFGHALLVGPYGDVLVDAANNAPVVHVADINLSEVQRVRNAMPCARHRRADVLGPVAQL
ncbi:unnamed protein product [Agarophyton chilense]|eukprot:gb/GEZJ01003910.1/.p1 GENE.gb/GEZJ01003910.1/~~gb/GEZJ01003910.1/.p1  ORF type:complete len:284 (-),score=25.36 gb/GEZJ01003910.1/:782-1633(-)